MITTILHTVIEEHIALTNNLKKHGDGLSLAVSAILDAITDRKVMFAGNGGSAADAQHLAAEFIGRFQIERFSLPAIALTTDTSIITAIGNDYGFENIFSRQIEGLGRTGDLFFALSTSGNSANLVQAVKLCQKKSIRTIGLLGNDGGVLGNMVDIPIIIPSNNTARIQEMHITIGHFLCEVIEKKIATSSWKDNSNDSG